MRTRKKRQLFTNDQKSQPARSRLTMRSASSLFLHLSVLWASMTCALTTIRPKEKLHARVDTMAWRLTQRRTKNTTALKMLTTPKTASFVNLFGIVKKTTMASLSIRIPYFIRFKKATLLSKIRTITTKFGTICLTRLLIYPWQLSLFPSRLRSLFWKVAIWMTQLYQT